MHSFSTAVYTMRINTDNKVQVLLEYIVINDKDVSNFLLKTMQCLMAKMYTVL